MRKLILLAAVIIGGNLGFAQTKKEVINLDQVVITGTGTHKRMKDSPLPIRVITPTELGKYNVNSVKDALERFTPNVSVFTNGEGTAVSLNGVNEKYVLILENGKPISGDDRFDRINVSNIKRIEILNGAASALYGSDAIGGVINIITKDANSKIDVSNYSNLSSKGRITENISANIHISNIYSVLSYEYRHANSWQNNPIDMKTEKPTGKPTSVGYSKHSINEEIGYKFGKYSKVYLHGSYFNSTTNRPQDAVYYKTKNSKKPSPAYSYDMVHEAYTLGGGLKYNVNKKVFLDAEIYKNHYSSDFDYFREVKKIKPGDKINVKKVDYYNASIKSIIKISKDNKLSIGTEYVKDYLSSGKDNIDNKNTYTAAVYVQDELNLCKHLNAVAGLRYVYNENFKSHLTPSLALMLKIGQVNFRTSYSTGFKTPSLQEIYATSVSTRTNRYTIGNINLKPEKSEYFSLNAEYNFGIGTLSLTGYVNSLRDMINYRDLTEKEAIQLGIDTNEYKEWRQRDNIDHAKIKGISVNLDVMPIQGWRIGGGYSLNDSKANGENPIDKSVRNMGNLFTSYSYDWKNYAFNINLRGHIQGKRYSQTYGYAPKYQTWDINTNHTFFVGNRLILEPSLGVENIFDYVDDRPWNSNFSTLTPGRAVRISLLVKFR